MTEHRPWGSYNILDSSAYIGYKVKKINVYPGKRLSLHSHNKRSEYWIIVKGIGKVQLNLKSIEVRSKDFIYIPKKTLHRIENIGEDELVFVETQVGEYLGEDDIIRY